MTFLRLVSCTLFCVSVLAGAPAQPSAAQLAGELRQISLDETKVFRIRDLVLTRGDIKLYLNEGVLGFFKPINSRRLAAVFSSQASELGDAELILFPPTRGERASLASFTKSPNLDEHFGSALFLFTDDTAKEITDQIAETPLHPAPELAKRLADNANPLARQLAEQLNISLLQALLDNHPASTGSFYAVVGTQHFGPVNLMYEPTQAESVSIGAMTTEASSHASQNREGEPAETEARFQTWANFRPRRAPPPAPLPIRVSSYRLDTEFRPELAVSMRAEFKFKSEPSDGRTVPLELSPHLKVSSASVDGKPVEIVQNTSASAQTLAGSTRELLLITPTALDPAVGHLVSVQYQGSIVRKTRSGDLFVDDRNTWYPVSGFVLAQFDMFFHCPERLQLVSTGDLVSDTVAQGIRTVHRRTSVPAGFAGFNLGQYSVRHEHRAPYSIEVYSQNAADLSSDSDLPTRTADILLAYTKRWIPLPIHNIAVSPIAGYFGQGFPGLIYLSSVSFVKQENRPPQLRNARLDAFFSDLLLPHEVAHQWWGNIVRSYDYRSGWLNEAMANDSALQYLKEVKGGGVTEAILDGYREDLVRNVNGKTIESAGPIEFGERLIDNYDTLTWHVITYEKGAWILEMLRQRLGEENFRRLQLRLLQDYATKPISNEEFRQAASSFLGRAEPDHSLTAFFDTWVYGTGIPHLSLRGSGRSLNLQMDGVEEDFIADVPLRCRSAVSGERILWQRAGFGNTSFELPSGLGSCQLPSRRSFLYVAEK